jgi:hypothetical protein
MFSHLRRANKNLFCEKNDKLYITSSGETVGSKMWISESLLGFVKLKISS